MSQTPVDFMNRLPSRKYLLGQLGAIYTESDGEHVIVQVRATEMNKIGAYFAGAALLGITEVSAGALANHDDIAAAACSVRWKMTAQVTTFNSNSNSKGDALLCESRWATRVRQNQP